MPQLLVLNPAKRRRAKKSRSPAQKAATRRMIAANRGHSANPAPARKRRVSKSRRRVARRSNPVSLSRMVTRRRRRNPTSALGGGASIVAMLKGAAISGAGAVAVDLAYGQISKFLPASMLGQPGVIDQGDAVKAGVTVLLGKLLNKATRGLSVKAAQASLTVQAYGMFATLVPASMSLGYASPGRVIQGNSRVGPNIRSGAQQMGRYSPGAPLLSQYQGASASPLLNGAGVADRAAREGFAFR